MNTAGTSAKVEREPQVIAQKEKLNRELSSLENLVGMLQGRLENILRNPEPSPPEPTAEKLENEIVPFAHEIRVQKRRVASLNEVIENTLNRLEI